MKNAISLTFILILFYSKTFAQIDSTFNFFIDETNEFSNFIDTSHNEFNTYLNQINIEFMKFSDSSWKEFQVFIEPKPANNKPSKQPIYSKKKEFLEFEIKSTQHLGDSSTRKLENTYEIEYFEAPNFESKSEIIYFNFYGREESIRYNPDNLPLLTNISRESIKKVYEDFMRDFEDIWIHNIRSLQNHKNKYEYNDWGYFQLLVAAAESIYKNESDQAVFICFMLINSGYHATIAYTKNNVFLLIPTNEKLFDIPAISLNNATYYLLHSKSTNVEGLHVYTAEADMNLSYVSLLLTNHALFEEQGVERVIKYNDFNFTFAFNKYWIDFMKNYPMCDLKLYFEMPLSSGAWQTLDAYFKPQFDGKTNLEKVNILLDFVQNAIAYQTDENQFGSERYMFAEECFIFPFADCEDRSILLKQLVKHYTNLSVLALGFSNHCTLAIDFNESVSGCFVTIKNQKFFICDPTYINAKVGMAPDHLKSQSPMIIGFWK